MDSDQILKAYFDPKHPGSFGGPDRLAKSLKISKTFAKNTLERQKTYTENKSVRHKFIRRKISAPEIDYLWQADLVTVEKFSRLNKGIHFLLTVIDVHSRYAFVRQVKRKTGILITEAFNDIVTVDKRKPKYLQTDEGREFFNKTFTAFMKSNKISLYHNHSPLKAAMIERFNRTLMTRLQKVFAHRGKNIYHVLQDVVHSYNSSLHRAIGCAPNTVNKYNQMDIWFHSNKNLITKSVQKPLYKVGDF
jgi:transposase InsO family protein